MTTNACTVADGHQWAPLQHVRPYYCNVCTEILSNVSQAGLVTSNLSCQGLNISLYRVIIGVFAYQ